MSPTTKCFRVLVGINDATEAEQVRAALSEPAEIEIVVVRDAESLRTGLAEQAPDFVVVDPKLPGASGLELIEAIRASAADAAVVILTEQADSDDLYQVVQLGGIRRYLLRPWCDEHTRAMHQVLTEVLLEHGERMRARALEHERDELARENASLREALRAKIDWSDFPAESMAMKATVQALKRLAGEHGDACLLGPTGSGRVELVRAVHLKSERASAPLVMLRGEAALGTETVTLRWQAAAGGTLVLSELEALELPAQTEILRLMEGTGSTASRPRVIALATVHPDRLAAWEALDGGLARMLAADVVEVPGLDARREDRPALAARILERLSADYRGRGGALSPQALADLDQRELAGNLPELEALLERAVAEAQGETILRLPNAVDASS